MKQHKIYIVCLLVGTLLAACTDAPLDNLPSEELVQLNLLPPTIEATPLTRTMPIDGTSFPWEGRNHASGYSTNYSVAMFICDKGSYNPHMAGYNNLLNVLHSSYYTNTHYQQWQTQISSRLEKGIDIYAYYPRVAQEGLTPETIPFTTTDQHDWMWANPVPIDKVGPDNRTVQLQFQHAMTCIEVRLSTKYEGTINLHQITLSDVQNQLVAKGTMDITNGHLNYTADQSSITITGNNDNNNQLPKTGADGSSYFSYCFIMPEKSFNEDDLRLSFVYDYVRPNSTPGRATYTIPTTFTDKNGQEQTITKLETGKKYVLNLVIDNATSIYPLSQQIDEWATVDVNLKI